MLYKESLTTVGPVGPIYTVCTCDYVAQRPRLHVQCHVQVHARSVTLDVDTVTLSDARRIRTPLNTRAAGSVWRSASCATC